VPSCEPKVRLSHHPSVNLTAHFNRRHQICHHGGLFGFRRHPFDLSVELVAVTARFCCSMRLGTHSATASATMLHLWPQAVGVDKGRIIHRNNGWQAFHWDMSLPFAPVFVTYGTVQQCVWYTGMWLLRGSAAHGTGL
jgi:hypothetical protein